MNCRSDPVPFVVAPHIPVTDRSTYEEGIFSRDDFMIDKEHRPIWKAAALFI